MLHWAFLEPELEDEEKEKEEEGEENEKDEEPSLAKEADEVSYCSTNHVHAISCIAGKGF